MSHPGSLTKHNNGISCFLGTTSGSRRTSRLHVTVPLLHNIADGYASHFTERNPGPVSWRTSQRSPEVTRARVWMQVSDSDSFSLPYFRPCAQSPGRQKLQSGIYIGTSTHSF